MDQFLKSKLGCDKQSQLFSSDLVGFYLSCMAFASFSSSQLLKLSEKTFHPSKSFNFSSREFGKKKTKNDLNCL
jgi:hypothetical protein